MADLSEAANVFAVVGAADVVFRAGKELVEFILKVQRASREADDLLHEIRDVTSTVAEIQLVAAEYERSPFALDDRQAWPDLRVILQGCQQEFAHLHLEASRASARRSESWIERIGGRLCWVLNEQEVTQSRQRLTSYRRALISSLTAIGCRNDIANRTQIKAVREDVAALTTSSTAGFRHLEQSVATKTTAVSQDVQNLSTDVKAIAVGHKYDIQAVQTSLALSSTILTNIEQSLYASSSNKDSQLGVTKRAALRSNRQLTIVNKNLTRYYKRQHRVDRQQFACASNLDSKVDQLQSSLAGLTAKYGSCNLSTFMGSCNMPLDMITTSIILMRAPLAAAIRTITQNTNTFSPDQACWILSEFENLLAASHEASAAVARGRRDSLRQNGASMYAHMFPPPPVDGVVNGSATSTQMARASTAPVRTSVTSLRETVTYRDEMAGWLELLTSMVSDETSGQSFLAVSITWLPRRELSTTGLSIALEVSSQPCAKDVIVREVLAYNAFNSSSRATWYAHEDHVEWLQGMLKEGVVSVSDRDELGYTLLVYAALKGSMKTFQLLLQEGADPLQCSPTGRDIVWYIKISSRFWPDAQKPNEVKMVRLAHEKGCYTEDNAPPESRNLLDVLLLFGEMLFITSSNMQMLKQKLVTESARPSLMEKVEKLTEQFEALTELVDHDVGALSDGELEPVFVVGNISDFGEVIAESVSTVISLGIVDLHSYNDVSP